MDYHIDDEAVALRSALSEFLAGRGPRPATEPDRAHRIEWWRELVESQWLEHFSTASEHRPAELVAAMHVAEAFGAHCVPGPIDVVAGYLWPLAAATEMSGLPAQLRSTAMVTASLPELTDDGRPRWRHPQRLSARRRAGAIEITGALPRVTAASDAELFVVPIELDEAPALAVVPAHAEGCAVGDPAGVDLRRPVAGVRFDRTTVDREGVYLDTALPDHEHRAAVLHSLFLDAEAIGGGDEVLRRTIDYCDLRTQFGKPVGSFQAIRHRLADTAVAVEGARSLANRAAWDIAAAAPTAPVDVVASRLWASSAYLTACEAGVQCHGGAGFTWEQELHVWYRAALAGRGLGTQVAAARDCLARHLGRLAEEPAATSPVPDTVGLAR